MTRFSTLRFTGVLLLLWACGGGDDGDAPALAVDAGEDISVRLGSTVTLEGASAANATFRWEVLRRPADSEAEPDDETAPSTTFTPDLAGGYTLRLTAKSGNRAGHDDLILIVLPNQPPTADAGGDQVVLVGEQVQLDGRGSSDPDGDALSYAWTVLTRPAESQSELSNPASRTPLLPIDAPGIYEVRLVVDDGTFQAEDVVEIRGNRGPTADAGPDQSVLVGELVVLDGSGSSDPDGDPLTYTWSLLSQPPASALALRASDSETLEFSPDVQGTYLVELEVSDGVETSTDLVTVECILEPTGFPGSIVYVAPDGSDTNVGTKEAPLATLAAGIAKVEELETVSRIALEAGEYQVSAVQRVDGDLEIVGPEEGDGEAILQGEGALFSIEGSERLALNRVTLRTDGIAIYAGSSSTVSLTSVVCEAYGCVRSGEANEQMYGGTIRVRRSILRGTGKGMGVAVELGREVMAVESTFVGFLYGLYSMGTTTLVEDCTFEQNTTGVYTYDIYNDNVFVVGGRFVNNDTALSFSWSRNITVHGASISEGTTGVDAAGSAVVLREVDISRTDGTALSVRAAFQHPSTVTVRGAHFSSIGGHGVHIRGAGSTVDMGTETTEGRNSIHAAGWPLLDERPMLDTGLVTMSETTLGGAKPAPARYRGPIDGEGFRITNQNSLFVY